LTDSDAPTTDGPRGALDRLGCTDAVGALFAPHAAAGLTLGRVIRADRGSALVATAEAVVRAEPSARLRKAAAAREADMPAAGDWVAIDDASEHDVALIEAVLPRQSAFARADPGKSAVRQVLAANIDTVFVVHAIDTEPNVRRIERELSVAWDSGATPVVVLSKADLAPDADGAREAVEAVAPGVDVYLTSSRTGEGIEPLLAYAEGHRTVALIGPSGAGKSTLINRLVGEDVQATREVRVFDGKGRHTTVTRELVPLPGGGILVDTPGLRGVAMWDAEDGIAAAFSEIGALAERCRFRDCTHTDEPDCAVLAAVECGELDAGRLESWRKLLAETRAVAARADAKLAADDKRKWKSISKARKDINRERGNGGR
jgi:ribosome biogenesis GTPase